MPLLCCTNVFPVPCFHSFPFRVAVGVKVRVKTDLKHCGFHILQIALIGCDIAFVATIWLLRLLRLLWPGPVLVSVSGAGADLGLG